MIEIGDILGRIWTDIAQRPDGPMAIRVYLQPIVAALLAVRDGVKDARSGSTPYFWAIVFRPEQRAERFREGLRAVGKVMIVAVLLDVVYQWKVMGRVYPGEALIVAVLLAYLPYLLLRGPVARLVHRLWSRNAEAKRA